MGRNQAGRIDYMELAALGVLTFLFFLGMPLMISFAFPVCFVIGIMVLIFENYEYSDAGDWLPLLFIPWVLTGFTLGCVLNVIVIPIGLLVTPPALFYTVVIDEWKRRERAKRNRM